MQYIGACIFSWLISLPVFIIVSTFLHELSHYLVAKLVGFKIVGVDLITIPFKRRGYVDVLVKRNQPYVLLRKALMHSSGILVHFFFIIISVWFLIVLDGIILKGIWVVGLLVNLYLFFINFASFNSDGRRLFEVIHLMLGRRR